METSFEVVTILFNFHRWTCVVGPLALAMSLAKVSGIFSRLKKRLFLGCSSVVPRCIYWLMFWLTWSKIDSVDRKH